MQSDITKTHLIQKIYHQNGREHTTARGARRGLLGRHCGVNDSSIRKVKKCAKNTMGVVNALLIYTGTRVILVNRFHCMMRDTTHLPYKTPVLNTSPAKVCGTLYSFLL